MRELAGVLRVARPGPELDVVSRHGEQEVLILEPGDTVLLTGAEDSCQDPMRLVRQCPQQGSGRELPQLGRAVCTAGGKEVHGEGDVEGEAGGGVEPELVEEGAGWLRGGPAQAVRGEGPVKVSTDHQGWPGEFDAGHRAGDVEGDRDSAIRD